jgi:hypothetical protein
MKAAFAGRLLFVCLLYVSIGAQKGVLLQIGLELTAVFPRARDHPSATGLILIICTGGIWNKRTTAANTKGRRGKKEENNWIRLSLV